MHHLMTEQMSLTPVPPCGPNPSGRFRQWGVILRRELWAVLLNRFIYVLSAVALAIGCAPLISERPGESAPYFLIQATLYVIPLFSLLIGIGSVQGDQEERPFLLTQPVSRLTMVLGKWVALFCSIVVASLLTVLPSALGDTALDQLFFLGSCTVLIGGVFLALGMAIGYATNDRVKAHLLGLCVWIALMAGIGFVALSAAQAGYFRDHPALWLLILMVNPLDAFRIGVLFTMGNVLLKMTDLPGIGVWWFAHPMLWLTALCGVWIGVALAWCWYRLNRLEG